MWQNTKRVFLDSVERVLSAAAQLLPEIQALMGTEDASEGIKAFIERRDGVFSGR